MDRALVLEYVDIDSFIAGQTGSFREQCEQQFGNPLPANYEEAVAAFQTALENNRKWFEDKLVDTFPPDIEEEWFKKVIAFNKTQLVQVLATLNQSLIAWVADTNARWLAATPDIALAWKPLIGIDEPTPLPADGIPTAEMNGKSLTGSP